MRHDLILPRTLYVVATPIGHLSDISARAIEVLSKVDLILAEDTRETKSLLAHYQIQTPVKAYHEHNERALAVSLALRLQAGETMALVTDRGTPLISDPGYPLVEAAHAAGVTVSPVPGPCAVVAALSVSGLPTDRFCFEGFLPAKMQQRMNRLSQLSEESRTLIFYESPHRILAMLSDVQTVLGADRLIVVARELTKRFETIYRGRCDEVIVRLQSYPEQVRGEFVVCVSGSLERMWCSENVTVSLDELIKVLLMRHSVKEAANIASALTGLKKNALYQRALALHGA